MEVEEIPRGDFALIGVEDGEGRIGILRFVLIDRGHDDLNARGGEASGG
jgi:hypothetical protein